MKKATLIVKLLVLSLFCWMLVCLAGNASAQTWTELGTNAPDHGPGDIWQTNTSGGASGQVTGGLNYYTDDYPANLGNPTMHGGPGQVFQIGNSNMVLTAVTIKTFNTDEGASTSSTGNSANYRLKTLPVGQYEILGPVPHQRNCV